MNPNEVLDVVPTRPELAKRTRGWIWLAARALGALAVLATGAVHLYEFGRARGGSRGRAVPRGVSGRTARAQGARAAMVTLKGGNE